MLTFCLCINDMYGQISTKELPVSFKYNDIKWEEKTKVLPSLDMAKIEKEDSEDEKGGIPPRFGYSHKVDFNLENSGEWTTLATGDKIWRLDIYCPNALSINLLYNYFK